MTKIVVTPQGFKFVESRVYSHFEESNEYILTNGIVSDSEKLAELLSDADAVVIGTEQMDATLLESAKNLKLIVRFGTSLKNIDISKAESLGIKVRSIKSQCTVGGVARLCTAYLLNYTVNIQKHLNDSRSGSWRRYLNYHPSDITVGLVGSGDIARQFFDFAHPFGFKFKYFSRKVRRYFDEKGAEYCDDLWQLIESSDVVSLHVPLNDDTYNLLGKDELDLLKDKALINTSRALIVNQKELMLHLEQYPEFYYFTDVLATEPPNERDLRLITLPNVFSTAHIGGYTSDALEDVAIRALQIIKEEL